VDLLDLLDSLVNLFICICWLSFAKANNISFFPTFRVRNIFSELFSEDLRKVVILLFLFLRTICILFIIERAIIHYITLHASVVPRKFLHVARC